MRLYNKTALASVICLSLLLYGFSFESFAHHLWVEVSDFTPDSGRNISITLAYDHIFPAKDYMEDKNLKELYILDPAGHKIGIKKKTESEYIAEQLFKDKGTFLVIAAQKARFWTKTTEGYQSDHSKKGLQNVISCTNSLKFGKGIINLGKGMEKNLFHAVGHDLEIIPLNNPGILNPGDYMSIQLLFKGRPLSSSNVYATYMGFSTEKDTYAYTTKTNAEGTAKIKMLKQGVWLIVATHSDEYHDQDVCDTNKYSATLTFELKE